MKSPAGSAKDDHAGWQRGPLPPGTWDWGGVVLTNRNMGGGFFFADFLGDKVVLVTGDSDSPPGTTLTADQVAWFNNSLTVPPTNWD